MTLYANARANLTGAYRDVLDGWEAAALALPPEGPNVVANVRNESHLVGDPPQAGSLALEGFIHGMIARFGAAGAKQSFEEAAGAHFLHRRPLASPPESLHRFRPIDRFGESVALANGDISRWKFNREEYVTNLLENWNTIGRETLWRGMLGAHPVVFVTFAKPDGSLVTDRFRFGPEIMDALGLRGQADQDVIGLRYPAPPDAPLKYPTAADGGWNQDFRVASPGDDHGWTRPISDPGAEGWPEAVHQNRKADLVTQKPSRHPRA